MGTQDVVIDETPIVDNSIGNKDETPNKENSQDGIDYKQRYSDSTKEAQKILAEKREVEKENLVNNAFRQVLRDNSKLLELDEEVAREVVKAMHEDGYATTDSYEELLDFIKWTPKEDLPLDKEKLTAEIREKIKAEEQEEKSNELLEKKLSKYDKETRDKYLAEFKEVLWDKKLTPAIAEREIEKIIVYYGKNKDDEALSNLASNSIKTTKTGADTVMTKEKLTSMWIPEHKQVKLYPELFPKK